MTRGLDPKPRQTLDSCDQDRATCRISHQAIIPFMLTADGHPVIERLAEMNLLPPPETNQSRETLSCVTLRQPSGRSGSRKDRQPAARVWQVMERSH